MPDEGVAEAFDIVPDSLDQLFVAPFGGRLPVHAAAQRAAFLGSHAHGRTEPGVEQIKMGVVQDGERLCLSGQDEGPAPFLAHDDSFLGVAGQNAADCLAADAQFVGEGRFARQSALAGLTEQRHAVADGVIGLIEDCPDLQGRHRVFTLPDGNMYANAWK